MLFTRRSWVTTYLCTIVLGIVLMGMGVLLRDTEPPMAPVILFLIGLVITIIGVAVMIWYEKDKRKYTGGKIDKNTVYTFTLTTEEGKTAVQDFAQIQRALKRQNETKSGNVKMDISPSLGGIESIESVYQSGAFYTYVLQQRENGQGYWFMICDSTVAAENDFRRLYKNHKKVDFNCYNRKETGEGR